MEDPRTSGEIVKEIEKRYPIKHRTTLGQRYADRMTTLIGSWTFIFIVVTYIIIWMALNLWLIAVHWDPYPFIVLNLTLSCLAALQAPVILMSQNRQTERDRIGQARDYMVDRESEKRLETIQREIAEMKAMLSEKK